MSIKGFDTITTCLLVKYSGDFYLVIAVDGDQSPVKCPVQIGAKCYSIVDRIIKTMAKRNNMTSIDHRHRGSSADFHTGDATGIALNSGNFTFKDASANEDFFFVILLHQFFNLDFVFSGIFMQDFILKEIEKIVTIHPILKNRCY